MRLKNAVSTAAPSTVESLPEATYADARCDGRARKRQRPMSIDLGLLPLTPQTGHCARAASQTLLKEITWERAGVQRGPGSIRVWWCSASRRGGFSGGTPEIARGDACAPQRPLGTATISEIYFGICSNPPDPSLSMESRARSSLRAFVSWRHAPDSLKPGCCRIVARIWRLRGLFPRFQYVAGGGVCAGGFEARAAEDNDAPAFCPDGSSPKKRRQT
jgi:hypothetical protein